MTSAFVFYFFSDLMKLVAPNRGEKLPKFGRTQNYFRQNHDGGERAKFL